MAIRICLPREPGRCLSAGRCPVVRHLTTGGVGIGIGLTPAVLLPCMRGRSHLTSAPELFQRGLACHGDRLEFACSQPKPTLRYSSTLLSSSSRRVSSVDCSGWLLVFSFASFFSFSNSPSVSPPGVFAAIMSSRAFSPRYLSPLCIAPMLTYPQSNNLFEMSEPRKQSPMNELSSKKKAPPFVPRSEKRAIIRAYGQRDPSYDILGNV